MTDTGVAHGAQLADPDRVREFLTNFGGPWHLARTGCWGGDTFTDLDVAVDRAVAANNLNSCVYYMGNRPKGGFLQGSRKESDIAECVGSWLDIDDPDPVIFDELVTRLDWPPTYAAFTGGGWQAFWRYDESTGDINDARAISVWLQHEFADLTPDSTHSVEHLFRLPGTCNRKAGRENRMCRIQHERWDNVLPLTDAGRMAPEPRVKPVEVNLGPVTGIARDELWQCLPPWAVRLLDDPTDREGRTFASRNEQEWSFIGACVRQGVLPELIRDCLLYPAAIDETNKISHRSYWAKIKGRFVRRRNPEAHALRQIGSFIAQENCDG